MDANARQLEIVTALVKELQTRGFEPVLVGGMALVILGSQRVTYDFDLLISTQGPPTAEAVKIMNRHHLALVTKLTPDGDVKRTVDSSRVAAAKVKIEKPTSLRFFNSKTELRVDLLLDFPMTAHALAGRATQVQLKNGTIMVAATADLLRLKEIAFADRKTGKDAQDLEFLRKKL